MGTLGLLMMGCGGSSGSSGTPAPKTYVLTVNSVSPASGAAVIVTPADANGAANGTTGFTRSYPSGTSVTLTAAATVSGASFVYWSGCFSASTVACTVQLGGDTTVTANYNATTVASVTVGPNPANVTIGATLQFAAVVVGTGSYSPAVTWSVAAPSGSSLSPGTISAAGLYTTPYPAPSTVTVTATSTTDPTVSGSAIVNLAAPPAVSGPALTVDAGNETHAISPLIYGMNAYDLDTTTAATANITVARWGGDNTSRYNYQTNTSNAAGDYYFENSGGAAGLWPTGDFNDLVTADAGLGIRTMGTVPLLGWVTNSSTTACSFTQASYPGQKSYNGSCGDGIDPQGINGCTSASGCGLFGNATIAALTSMAAPPPTPPGAGGATNAWAAGTWSGGWVSSVASANGPGNPPSGPSKGVAIWDLDNEPAWWDAVHRDVHPIPSTYDEVTQGGIGTAVAIKTVDPTAQVSGPVVDYWWNYFYSKQDIESGWSTGPCYQPWSNPTDRAAHGGVPFIEYYLQQFKSAEATYGMRLLDYVDIHAYFAATYPAVNGSSVGLTTAGDTGEQQARLNSTRAFWDPTYTDPNDPQPNYRTDANYTSGCSPAVQAPQMIRMMQSWVSKDYPGTMTSIDEYNFGGLESINGAVTQADILGIFGREGLSLATLWPTTTAAQQVPGTMAFAIYRNYDGNKSTFGNMALASTSANQGVLSVYGALRTADNTVTIVVINKTYANLTTMLSLANLTPASTTAQAYLYSAANLNGIVAQPAVTVTPPAVGSTTSTLSTTFPAQSITLLLIPKS